MTVKIFVPCDSSALSVGADEVAVAIAAQAASRGIAIELIRTGSRGLFYLEPLVEVLKDGVRYGFGPVQPDDIARLFDAGFPDAVADQLALGPVEEIAYLKNQDRLTFSRCGIVDPLSISDYEATGGLTGLRNALAAGPDAIIATVLDSGLRGRGGAGFPTGIKWKTVQTTASDQKYVVCNADEGDSGTFADRLMLEGDPFCLIEGMTIAALGVGATKGFVYLRSEYPHSIATLANALEAARRFGLLGPSILGSDNSFDIEIRVGGGAYICGEETAMLESIEGKRGIVRAKPPLPAIKGLFGKPTVINNLLSLVAVPWILANGGKAYAEFGMGRSRGTQPIQLAGNVKRGGLIEIAFGITIRDIVETYGGGTLSGRPIKAVQVGGPLGAYFPDNLLDTPLDYEAMLAAGGMLGHGGIVVFDDLVDMAAQARFAMAFCAAESCGKCTPCRIGSTRGVEVIDKIAAGVNPQANHILLDELCTLMADASLCALGGLTPMPVRSAVKHFSNDFQRRPISAQAAE
jgi:formate dehydrogenase iron-sulfur subunit